MTAEILCGACIGAFLTFAFFINLSKGGDGDAKKDNAIAIMQDGLLTYKRIAESLERIEAKMPDGRKWAHLEPSKEQQ